MAKKPKLLSELFHDTLKDVYFAEKKILATLPKMAKAAQSKDLKAAFVKHERETDADHAPQPHASHQPHPRMQRATSKLSRCNCRQTLRTP